MPRYIKWYIPKRVLYLRMWGVLTTDDVRANSEEAIRLTDEGIPLVHSILDDGAVEKVPMNLGEMQRMLEIYKHPSLGWVISVGNKNPLFQFFASVIAQIYRVRARRFNTMPEALAFLREQDSTLNWDEADNNVFTENPPVSEKVGDKPS